RIYDRPRQNKFHFLSSVDFRSPTRQDVVFKSAKYNHRPPLIDRNTAEERSNPKRLQEGDSERTHLGILVSDDEATIIMEERRSGISRTILESYLNTFLKAYRESQGKKRDFHIEITQLLRKDFLVELSKFNRITDGQIYVTRSALNGSEFLRF